MLEVLTIGFSLGMLSSLHCVGMCGPLALSLPLQGLPRWRQVGGLTIYHAGRIGVYGLLGLASGMVGRRFYLAGWQHGVSIALGISILAILIGKKWMPRRAGIVQGWVVRLWQVRSRFAFLFMGMANGLLPCGMVYLAVATALSRSGAEEGVSLMIAFGLGTLPALLLLHFSRQMLGAPLRNKLRKLMPVIMVVMAVALILRGMNLGIPFVSPVLAGSPGQPVSCH